MAVQLFDPSEDLHSDLYLSGALRLAIDDLLAELRCVERFVSAGVDPPTRVLLSGPSGTGKTLAVRWIARKLRRPCAIVDVAGTLGPHIGDTSKALTSAFADARAKKAVLFLDEIDAVCVKRGGSDGQAVTKEMERATTTLFQSLDWLEPGAIVFAATNFPDHLDAALRRRLTTHIEFHPPDRDARREMLGHWLARAPLPPEQLDAIADRTEGLSGADLRSQAMAVARRAVMALPDDRPRKKRLERAADGAQRGQAIMSLLDTLSTEKAS